MDSITQAALGAGIGGAILGRQLGRTALVAGAVLGTLPDLDILIDYGDPLSQMINHRGFSHSVFVLTALSVVMAWLVRRWRPHSEYTGLRLFMAIWLILITHTLLDAFTSYGTQLWWPLRPTPASWSSIFIIDPFYTIPLLLAVIVALIVGLRPASCRALTAVLLVGAAYLLASLGTKHWAEVKVTRFLQQQGIRPVAMFSAPQPFNIILWRVVARTDDGDYVEAVTGLLDNRAPEFIRFPANRNLLDALDDPGYVEGLLWFTGDWLRYDAIDGHLVVSDLRMGIGSGHYSFRFLVGRQNSDTGRWEAVTPRYWRESPPQRDMQALKQTIRRVWKDDPALPLEEWDRRMTQPPSVTLPASITDQPA